MVVRELITVLGFKVNHSQLAKSEKVVKDSARRMKASMHNIAAGMTAFAVAPLAMFGRGVVTATSNIELLEVSLTTMLGSSSKAKKMMEELFTFARNSPMFQIKDIGPQAKKLLATSFKPEEIIPSLKVLGDIAAGVSVPLERIVLNYSQVRAQGKLTGRELRDFAVAGVPLLKELSKMTNRTEGEVFQMIRRSEVSFPMVEKAFKNMTSTGGLFFKMQENASKTMYGMWQKVVEGVYLFQVQLGQKAMPVIKKFVAELNEIVNVLLKLDNNWMRFGLIAGITTFVGGAGIALITFFGSALLIIGEIVIALGLLSLVIDDLYVWFKGGKSVFGEFFGSFDSYVKEYEKQVKRLKKALVESGLDKDFDDLTNKIVGGMARLSSLMVLNVKNLIRLIKQMIFSFLDDVVKRITTTINLIGYVKRIVKAKNFKDAAIEGAALLGKAAEHVITPPKKGDAPWFIRAFTAYQVKNAVRTNAGKSTMAESDSFVDWSKGLNPANVTVNNNFPNATNATEIKDAVNVAYADLFKDIQTETAGSEKVSNQ